MSLVLPGRVAAVGRWAGNDSAFNVEALFDLWNLDPKNSTLGDTLTASGTTPPAVTLTGSLIVPYGIRVEITTLGALGVAVFRVSLDNGTTWLASGVTTAATYAIAGTAIVLNFAAGTYATDNVYRATVATAVDASPRLIHALQATPANQPFFTAANASFNGNPTWNGPNATVTSLDTPLFTPITSATTYCIVGMTDTTAANHNTINRIQAGTGTRIFTYTTFVGNGCFQSLSTTAGFFRGNLLRPGIAIVEYSNTTVSAWINGNYLGTVPDVVTSINSLRLMNNASATPNSPWRGSLADVRIAGKVFSLTERRAVFKYFSDKHAIPIALAS